MGAFQMNIQPYTINVSQNILDDLQDRLARTRWPDEIDGVGWDYGADQDYMQELVAYWQHQYDWRKQEAALNRFAQFTAVVDGEQIHFIHERGKGPNSTPLILFHGWPDSIYRYAKLIPMLTDPARFGGDLNDSFDVIVPSLLDSSRNPKKKAREQKLRHFAERSWRLMTEGLGYKRFVAGGGDGGSPLSQCMAVDHPESLLGIHLTDIGFHATMAQYNDLSETESTYLQENAMWGYQEGAYAVLLGTKPQTFAFGLNDSPVGWASLVIEKFRTWSDCDGDIEKRYTKDDLLTNIMLNWIEGIDPRGYREEWVSPSLQPNQQVDVPVGLALPPHDLGPVTPREFAARNLKNIQSYSVLAHGGHFVALEYPELLAEDIRAFVRPLRKPLISHNVG